MNKLRYRIVFNKLRGQQMVVAETARGAGKGAGADSHLPAPGSAAHPLLRMLAQAQAQALAQAFSVSLLLAGGSALAQVVGDPGAPGGQRPTVLTAANGVTVVNIQTASGAGVSRNSYTQFDVPKGGVILNNSRTDAQTQLGGWVQANPWLAKGQARVILNEVNSSNPSRLQGFVEVAGQRAEVIIANPSGIAVDGGGFINVSRATLTTGSARVNDGHIDGFTVARGQISIDGAGLDASSTDYTALIARSVAVNAALWAQQLNVVTGPGDVTVAGDSVSIVAKAGQEGAPSYAIDVSRLGGMYANKIFLVGSEAGVGVRNAGNVGAAAGELVVTADGRLENAGQLAASTQVRLNGRAVDNSGRVAADGNVTVAGTTVNNSGAIRSAGTVQVTAQGDLDNSAGTLEATRLELASTSGSLRNRGGKIIQGGSAGLDLASATLRNADRGQIGTPAPASGSGIDIGTSAGTVPPADAGTSPGTVTTPAVPILASGVLRAAQAIDNSGGTVTAGGVITLATSAIDNSDGKLYLRELAFNGSAFVNRAGTVELVRQFSVTAPLFDNTGGSIVAGGAFDAGVGSFTNTAGVLRAASVRVDALAGLDNRGGTLASDAALALSSGGAVDNDKGRISGAAVTLAAASFSNRGGAIQAQGPLEFSASGLLDNADGAIESIGTNATFALHAGAFDSAGGRLVNSGAGATTIGVDTTLFNSGTISAAGTLALQAVALRNTGGSIAAGSDAVFNADSVDNSGTVSSAGTLTYTRAGATLRNSGSMVAAGALQVTLASIDNNGGQLATAAGSGSALVVQAGDLTNRGGAIMADGGATITASGNVDNAGGLVQGARGVQLDVAGGLGNQGGAIDVLAGAHALSVRAGSIDSDLGRIVNAGTGSTLISSTGMLRSGGLIQGAGTLDVRAATLQQTATGQLLSGADLLVTVGERFDNAGAIGSHGALTLDGAVASITNSGQVIAAGPLSIRAVHFGNDGGQLATTQDGGAAFTLAAGSVSNRAGSITSAGAIDATVTTTFDNNGGTLQAARDVHLAAGGAMANDGGTIEASGTGSTLLLTAGSLTSLNGRIVNAGSGAASIASASTFVNSGLVASNGTLVLGAGVLENLAGGAMSSATTLALDVTGTLKNAGTLASNGALTFRQAGATLDNSGAIKAGGPVTLDLAQLRNDGGTLATDAALSVHAQDVSNRAGAMGAQGAASFTVRGALDNATGTIRSNTSLLVATGDLLGNNGGTVETGGAGSTMQLQAGAIDSLQGRIVNAGSGSTTISSAGQLVNSGLIGANGLLDIDAATVGNRIGGTIQAGQALDLATTRLDNAGTLSSRATLALAGTAITNSGRVLADGAILVNAEQFNNDSGQLATTAASGASIGVTAASLSNRGGSILADGSAGLTVAGQFDNSAGQVQANTALVVDVGALTNTGGTIDALASGATLAVHAATLENDSGRIANAGTGATTVASTGSLFNSGVIQGAGALDLAAQTLTVAAAGKVASAGKMVITAGQQFNNAGVFGSQGSLLLDANGATVRNSGQIVAAGAATLHAASLVNDGGQVATAQGGGADLTVRAGSISNAGGALLADGAAIIASSGALDNHRGAIESVRDLSVTASGALNNDAGVIDTQHGQAALTVTAQDIGNAGGRIVNAGTGATRITSQNAFVSSGLVGGNGAVVLSATSFANLLGGTVSAAGGLDLHITGALDNAGAIGSSGAFTFQQAGATFANTGAISVAGPVTIVARSLGNQGGTIEALGDIVLASGGAIDNTRGTVRTVRDLQATAGASLQNDAGVVETTGAGSTLQLQAAAISSLAGRIVNAGLGNTTIASSGGFVNSGLVAGNGALAIDALALSNRAGGILNAGAGMRVSVAQQWSNAGVVSAHDALDVQAAGAVVTNSSQIVAGGPVTIAAHALYNDGGHIATGADSGADIVLTAGSLSNVAGTVLADRNASVSVAGNADNRGGAIQAGNALQLTAGGALDNHGGAIEDGGVSAAMHVAAQSIDNTAGRIVNAGTGATTIAAATALVSSGVIAGNGVLAIDAVALDNLAGATLSSGAALDLAVTQRFANLGAVSSVGAFTFQQGAAQFVNGGTIVAGGAATVNAASFDNSGGQLVTVKDSGAALVLSAASMANRGGVLLADGGATLASNSTIDNTAGIVQAGANLALTAGGLVTNDGNGAIEALGAGSHLALAAGQLANGSGRIANLGSGATTVASQTSVANNGLIAGNGNVTVTAATLQNRALGTIGSAGSMELGVRQQFDNAGVVSSAGTLNFYQAGATFSNSGKIASGAGMGITAAVINNNNGGQLSTVRGAGGDILLAGAISNRAGQVLADGNATFNASGGFDNTQGTLQASKNLWLNATGALANNGGAIEALGTGSTLTVQAASIDNTAARIVNLGSGDTRLAAANGMVNSGTIGGNGNVFLSSQALANNTGGIISSGASLDLGVTGRLENRGAINSAGTLSFNQSAASLVNSSAITSGGAMLVHAASIDNRGGTISTGLHSGADLNVSAQVIDNEGGRIVADRDLALTAGQLLGAGEAGAGRDLAASLQGDYVNVGGAPRLTAGRDLALTVAGNFTNAATFAAVRNLSLSANAVTNLAGGRIEAQGVTIRPAGGLSNAGEINGAVVLDIATSGNIDNTGALIGGVLQLSANNINNSGATALLGGITGMQLLAANDINNRGGATVYSAGWLAAQAATVNNLSSTIESSGDMAMTANTINNIRENVNIVTNVVTDTTTHMVLPSWYTHGDNNYEYDPKSSNYQPKESYFVNPADIISDTTFVTPDGYTIGRVIYTTHANDSAFFAAGSGKSGMYGHRERITTTAGTRTLYYLIKETDVANPDQGGDGLNGNPVLAKGDMVWDGPAISYSSQYGSCSNTCVRYTTVPGYDDPANVIALTTIRELAPSKDRLEIYRDAHHTATEQSLAPGAGAVARIASGGSMHLTVSQLLNNQYGDIMASGFLNVDGAGAKVNHGEELKRVHSFDGTWTTENRTTTAYTMPQITETIGAVGSTMSGALGVSITGSSFTNVGNTSGTQGIVRASVQVLGGGATGAVAAGSGAAGSGVGNQAGLQGGFGGAIANAAAAAGGVSADWNGNAGGAGPVQGSAGSASTAGLSAFDGAGNQASTGAAINGSTVAQAGQVAAVQGTGATGLAAGALQGAHSAGQNQSAAAATATGSAAVGAGARPGAGSVLTISPSGLFIKNPDANGKYLYETRSQFANLNAWASSDFLFSALGADPALMQKRLGDGFYEQRMVREQMNALTGRAPANGASDDSVYQALLGNAVSAAKAFGLRPGIALTADQVSALTSDIVWMESQQVKLPDGSIDTVLVPKVYLAHLGDGAVTPGGALVTGAGVYINTDQDIVNRGGVIDGGSGRTILVSGQDILNQGGTIRGGDILLAATRDVRNESLAATQTYSSANTNGTYTALSSQATIAATGALEVTAGRDITDVAGRISAASANLTAARDVNFNALATGSTYNAQVGQDAQINSSVTHALSQLTTTGNVVIGAGRDLTLTGAQLAIGGDGALLAGRALTVASVMNQVKTDEHGDASAKQYEKRAADNQSVVGSNVGAGGALQLAAGMKETAALTVSSSALAATGALSLNSTGNVVIGGVQELHVLDNASKSASSSTFTKKSSNRTDYVASSTLVGSSLTAGTVSVKSGNDILITGSALTAQKELALVAGRDIVVGSGQQVVDESHSLESKKSGFSLSPKDGIGYSKAQQQQNGTASSTTQLGSTISGGSVTAVAGRDLSIVASNVVADNAVVLAAARDVNIVSAQNTSDSNSASASKKSGFIGTAWQPAVGTVKTTEQGTSSSVTQAGSQVASLGGDVTIQAGERYVQTASNVLAPGGDIAIIAKDVQINAGYDTADSTSHNSFSKVALGGTISIPVVSAVQGIQSLASAAKTAGNDRMTALAAVTVGMQAADAVNGVMANGSPVGIKIGVSLGSTKSESNVVQSSSTAVGSTVKAGGNVTIVATGGGAASNITAIGSDISAGGNVALAADNKINLLAAESTSSQHSTNSSSGTSIGVAYSMGGAQNGFSLELAANRANGKADGESTIYTNSHISAGNTVNLQSGGDTNIKGGVVSAANVVGNIGGDLNVQSLQDKVVYDSKQTSAGVSVSVCIPPACYGASTVSGSYSKAAVNGDFLSVVEQSGIKAGDGGFQLVVHGNTDLIGGVISSSQAAIDQGKNSLATGSLTYTALQNKDVYEASSFAMSGSVSGKFGDQSAPTRGREAQGGDTPNADELAAGSKAAPSATGGTGRDSGSQASTTLSGISAGALTITDASKQAATGKAVEQALAGIATGVTTNNAASQPGALTQAWNVENLMKEVQAQTQITQAFSAQMPREIAAYATSQEESIKAQLKNGPDNLALQAELAKWGEGGSYRVALHSVSGALSGGIGGALGAVTVASSAQLLTDLQFKTELALVESGMTPVAARALAQGFAEATSIAVGSVVGGTAGASAALTTDTNNRQEAIAEISLIKKLAEDKAKQMCRGSSDCVKKMTLLWADALERESKGQVDAVEAAKNIAYLNKLVLASHDPNSEGARGRLTAYLSMQSTAKSILAPYAGQPILVNGKSFTVNGSVLTYFGATQAQFNDPYANEALGGGPDPVFWGVGSRDADRVVNCQVSSGHKHV